MFNILTLTSMALLLTFIVMGVVKYGLLPSYSAYSSKWGECTRGVHTWSVITLLAAAFLLPPMLEACAGSSYQAIGFFCPLYLIVVSLTPEWETDKTQHTIHMVGAIICALLGLFWLCVLQGAFTLVGLVATTVLITALSTRSLKASAVFWGEMVMFLSMFIYLLC